MQLKNRIYLANMGAEALGMSVEALGRYMSTAKGIAIGNTIGNAGNRLAGISAGWSGLFSLAYGMTKHQWKNASENIIFRLSGSAVHAYLLGRAGIQAVSGAVNLMSGNPSEGLCDLADSAAHGSVLFSLHRDVDDCYYTRKGLASIVDIYTSAIRDVKDIFGRGMRCANGLVDIVKREDRLEEHEDEHEVKSEETRWKGTLY